MALGPLFGVFAMYNILDWLVDTLRTYPELAIFLTLSIGYYIGNVKIGSFSLGVVTGTLLVGIIIGQLHIDISPQIKSIFFLMFLFAVGFGIGPQFVKGLANDGLPQALFSLVICLLILFTVVAISYISGYGPGMIAGLLAGSQTISASIGLATDAISNSGLSPDDLNKELSDIPVAYAVSYIFGTIGTGWIIAFLGPKILRINLQDECKKYEELLSDGLDKNEVSSIWLPHSIRAFKLTKENLIESKSIQQAENMFNERIFVEKISRDGKEIDFSPDTTLKLNDIIAISGKHEILVEISNNAIEEADEKLLDIPVESVDVIITNKAIANKTIAQLSKLNFTRGVFVNKIKRGLSGVNIPLLAKTKIELGDIVTISGTKKNVEQIIKNVGYADRPTSVTDMCFVGAAIFLGGVLGAITVPISGIPLTLSTSGGVLISGLVCGWLRGVYPKLGNIPSSTLWFMNSVGLNIFIAVVGISAGPTFIAGLKQVGIEIFFYGLLATSLPMIVAPLIAKYIFKIHPALILGCCGGARTSTASVAMVSDVAKSDIPMLGYTVPYAVANTLLTLWGLAVVLLI